MTAPDLHKLVDREIADIRHVYGAKDCILYALGLGLGSQASGPDLRYVYEENLRAVPTLLAVLASSSDWMRDSGTGIRWEKLVALSHDICLSAPLPTSGSVLGRTTVDSVHDRGAERGAIINWRRAVIDEVSGKELGTITAQALARANGGFGGEPPVRRSHPGFPPRDADYLIEWTTQPDQALLYRLSGDFNPLHADPEVAVEAGLERPILHGLCNLGIAAIAAGRDWPGGLPLLRSIGARYTDVFYPGDTLKTEVWHENGVAVFRCTSGRTRRTVLDDGVATFFSATNATEET
ncbi:putative (R)-specific enoyl-CoA hydratase [Cupriavidus taiwanensis]|uniref:MaoC/PaaZ C-terminal domain-containing protein n=1 Tax=Cupriavidus taiwanensis TaxID=164546 RepID=UPI000E15540B|nr:MaoC/PaaZ C-terminal domain-containing protein [Cupriavidus taiwanensis]SOZ18272.1 putative (R)-specific enoyl-CoA hydratase [Cupriavidus taiwanensis]SOZ31234.1 putative (R)-specific enoyl-CoA hydratase [Cupriavidus taiwanensis]SOZ47311.1 putative (R)-specific enoyl-CoA hydratase [Cupriavidus taiwanensis]